MDLLDELANSVDYDPVGGTFVWTVRVSDKAYPGKRAGTRGKRYRSITFKGKRFYEHRLAYYICHKVLPAMVDHINGDGFDNRIENLRGATNSQNQANRRRSSNNTSGKKGVVKYRHKWAAVIVVEAKSHFLGVFDDVETASAVYDEAAIKHFGEFARVDNGK